MLTAHFNHWCSSELKTFDKLCDLVVLELFKQSVPEYKPTYINEHKVTRPGDAAVMNMNVTRTNSREQIRCPQHWKRC